MKATHRSYLTLILAFFLPACTSVRGVKYEDGLAISRVSQNVMESTFDGNGATLTAEAHAFSALGAYTYCLNKGKLMIAFGVRDESETIDYTGMYTTPSYQTNSRSLGLRYETHYYPAKMTFPKFTTTFSCATHLYTPAGAPSLEPVGAELVSPITNDFKGGLLVRDIERDGTLKKGDVILSVRSKRIETTRDLTIELSKEVKQQFIAIQILRKAKKMTVYSKVKDLSTELAALNFSQIERFCKDATRGEKPVLCVEFARANAKQQHSQD